MMSLPYSPIVVGNVFSTFKLIRSSICLDYSPMFRINLVSFLATRNILWCLHGRTQLGTEPLPIHQKVWAVNAT